MYRLAVHVFGIETTMDTIGKFVAVHVDQKKTSVHLLPTRVTKYCPLDIFFTPLEIMTSPNLKEFGTCTAVLF